jgi:hypothetical protein
MDTTPRKGKKRAPPSTPTGRPPAKASRPSSPSDDPLGEMFDALSSPTPATSALPETPSFRRKAKATSHHGTDMPFTPAAMTVDPPRASTPAPEFDPLAFTTVDDELDDEEASSSFKELTDWLRYVAQHKGQRGRLLHSFLTSYHQHQFSKTALTRPQLDYYVYTAPQGQEEGTPLDSDWSAAGES